jgi:hypothetical protein
MAARGNRSNAGSPRLLRRNGRAEFFIQIISTLGPPFFTPTLVRFSHQNRNRRFPRPTPQSMLAAARRKVRTLRNRSYTTKESAVDRIEATHVATNRAMCPYLNVDLPRAPGRALRCFFFIPDLRNARLRQSRLFDARPVPRPSIRKSRDATCQRVDGRDWRVSNYGLAPFSVVPGRPCHGRTGISSSGAWQRRSSVRVHRDRHARDVLRRPRLLLTGSGLNVTCINMMLTQRFTPEDPRREGASSGITPA